MRLAGILILSFLFGACTTKVPIPTTGLQLWLKGDAGVVLNGKTVARWEDQSGHGNDAIQSDSLRQPHFIREALNGLPVLRFDGADDRLALTGSSLISEVSLFVVIKVDSGATGPNPSCPLTFGDQSFEGRCLSVILGPERVRGVLYPPGVMGIGSGRLEQEWVFVAAPDSEVVGHWLNINVMIRRTLWSTSVHINGDGLPLMRRLVNMSIDFPLGNSNASGVGGIGGADNVQMPPGNMDRLVAKCDVAELLLYNTVLPDSTRSRVQRYLAAKYQIP